MIDNQTEEWFSEGKQPGDDPGNSYDPLKETWDNPEDECWNETESWADYKARRQKAVPNFSNEVQAGDSPAPQEGRPLDNRNAGEHPGYAKKIMGHWNALSHPATNQVAEELRHLRAELAGVRGALERIAEALEGPTDEVTVPFSHEEEGSGRPPDDLTVTTTGGPLVIHPFLSPDMPLPQ